MLWACVPAMAATLGVAPADGSLVFHASSSLHPIEGVAREYSGTLDTDALRGTLDVVSRSLTTGLGPRDSRLLSWCLEATRFPNIHFEVTEIVGAIAGLRAASGAGTVSLDGTLTIRDIGREVNIPATYAWEGPNLRLKGRYEMKWTDWNIPDPSIVLSSVAPAMDVGFDIVARPL